jgi:hypothetical protein
MQFHRVAAGSKATNPGALLFDNAVRPLNMFANLQKLQVEINLPACFDQTGWILADSHEKP